MLERHSDPVALAAAASLESSEAPEELPCWTSSRAELLATYEARLTRWQAGEGPATQGLPEYVEALRDAEAPGVVDETGWAVGETFYVVVSHATTVLAVSTVARAVWHLGDELVHLDQGSYQWIDIKTFGVGDGFNDLTLIKNLVDQAAYADDYQGNRVEEQSSGAVHGPYRLDAVDPASFVLTTGDEARDVIQKWANRTGSQNDETQRALLTDVYALLHSAERVYRFPTLGLDAAHESGWVVGHTGFHEFVAIDRFGHQLHVIVASDDSTD